MSSSSWSKCKETILLKKMVSSRAASKRKAAIQKAMRVKTSRAEMVTVELIYAQLRSDRFQQETDADHELKKSESYSDSNKKRRQ